MNLGNLKSRLQKTHNAIMCGLESFLGKTARVESLEKLEEALITADMGVRVSTEIVDRLKNSLHLDYPLLCKQLKDSIYEELKGVESPLIIPKSPQPFVIMVLGVNGVGKTTTIGKLASYLSSKGKTVIIGACDTFRAAAQEQLEIWGKRTNCPVIKHSHGSDPGAVAFDTVRAAISRKTDVVVLDTAGRLHTKANLVEELKKIKRVVQREVPSAPHENLLVLDASTGQNALNQTRIFNEAVGVTGIVLTKLDGTAKGGIVVAIAKELSIPVRFIGIGEGLEDLREFDAKEFSEALV